MSCAALAITASVLDSACAITKGLSKPISRDCALACAKTGSPLTGKVYVHGGSYAIGIGKIADASGL